MAFVVRAVQAGRLPTPQLLCDEFVYAELARNVAEEGRLLFRGEPLRLSLLYPVLLAPAWLAERMETTYAVAKTINAALMTSAALPLYVLGRRVLSPWWALLAPVLTLLLPITLLSGLLMTESAFLPAFLLAAYALVLVVERPTLARQAFALATIALAAAVRFQGLVLAAVLVTAAVLSAVFELRGEHPRGRLRHMLDRLTPYWPTAAVFAGAVVGYLLLDAAGRDLGSYEVVASADYPLRDAWRMTRLHLADLALTSGLVPLSALILLSWRAFAGDSRTPSEHAFLAVVIAATGWLVVQAGLFTSRFTDDGIAERYTFYALPLLFVALALWLAHGLPRPPIATAFAAVLPAMLVFVEPLAAKLEPALLPSSLGLFSFYRLSTALEGGVDDLVWLLRVGAIAAAVAFALLWRPVARIAIPLALCALFLASTRPVAGQLRLAALLADSEPALDPNHEWIDDTVGDVEVGYLLPDRGDRFATSKTMLQVNFWNPSVRSVFHLGEPELCRLPAHSARIDTATGRIVAEDSRLPRDLVGPADLQLAGARLGGQGALALHRVVQPPTLLHSAEGVYADRWMGADASYTRYYGPAPGAITVDLSRQIYPADAVPSTVELSAGPLVVADDGSKSVGGPRVTRRAVLRPGEQRLFSIPARELPMQLTVHIEPTFPALAFGGGDERQLGAQVQFGFRPAES